MLSEDILVGDGGGEFQIGDGNEAMGSVGHDQRRLDRRVEGLVPYNGWRERGDHVKPNTTHTVTASIACTEVRRCHGD